VLSVSTVAHGTHAASDDAASPTPNVSKGHSSHDDDPERPLNEPRGHGAHETPETL
jgi:hypothetical protein